MDLADRASRLEAAERDSGIEKARQEARRAAWPDRERKKAANSGNGREMCIDCEDEIEPARRAALRGAQRCLDCQTLRERLTT
ncbi:MAG: TraR/DksA C4-type zinc finger protein [Alphaproteobacteria bacterium]